MPRKAPYEEALIAHGCVALDLANTNGIDKFFRTDIREGKEKLMPLS